jgi:hypothetical protein
MESDRSNRNSSYTSYAGWGALAVGTMTAAALLRWLFSSKKKKKKEVSFVNLHEDDRDNDEILVTYFRNSRKTGYMRLRLVEKKDYLQPQG